MVDEPCPHVGPIRRALGDGVPEPRELRRLVRVEREPVVEEMADNHHEWEDVRNGPGAALVDAQGEEERRRLDRGITGVVIEPERLGATSLYGGLVW